MKNSWLDKQIVDIVSLFLWEIYYITLFAFLNWNFSEGKEKHPSPFSPNRRCFDRWRHGWKRGVVEKLRATDTRWAAKRSKYNWHASHPRRWNRRWNRERPIITHSKARRTVQRPSLDVERSCFGPPLPAGFYPPFSRGGGRVSR